MVDYFEDTKEKIAIANLEKKYQEKAVKSGKELKKVPKAKPQTAKSNTSKKKKTGKISKTKAKKNYFGLTMYLAVIFGIFFLICYRYALVNIRFNEKEALKTEMNALKKEVSQLEVNIETQLNLQNIEKMAVASLGMKKLDNSQKVYVVLDKEDYTKTNDDTIEYDDTESWFEKLINILKP